jgi:hypothetical protein
LLFLLCLTELTYQFCDLSGEARVQAPKGNACSTAAVKRGNVSGDAQLHLMGDKEDLDVRPALEVDGGSLDEASGEAEVEDFSPEEERPVWDEDFGAAFAAIAAMTATAGDRPVWSCGGYALIFHEQFASREQRAWRDYRQNSTWDDRKKKADRETRSPFRYKK